MCARLCIVAASVKLGGNRVPLETVLQKACSNASIKGIRSINMLAALHKTPLLAATVVNER